MTIKNRTLGGMFPVLDWLAALTAHAANRGERLVRYYGWYSNPSRGKLKKASQVVAGNGASEIAEVPPPPSKTLRRRWADFMKQVYEADPLLCPHCGGSVHHLHFH